eukprot:3245873-Alexandrium_andersonii.AAC.1
MLAFGNGDSRPLKFPKGSFLRLGSLPSGPSSLRPALHAPASGVPDGIGNKSESVGLPKPGSRRA